MPNSIDTVKYDLKLYADAAGAAAVKPEELVPVFHRWIQEARLDELLIDVADYSHVPDGPGVVLIGHQAFYALDQADGRPGLLYSRRRESRSAALGIATLEERLRSIFRAALAACRNLETEAELAGRLRFGGGELVLRVNDRLAAAHRETAEAELRPALAALLQRLYGDGFEIRAPRIERERFALEVSAAETPGAAALFERLDVN